LAVSAVIRKALLSHHRKLRPFISKGIHHEREIGAFEEMPLACRMLQLFWNETARQVVCCLIASYEF